MGNEPEPRAGNAVRVVRAVDPSGWDSGRELVLRVSAETGWPDPAEWPAHLLGPHTDKRQQDAESVWLALDGELCVGHALISAVRAGSSLALVPALREAAETGMLWELGGLAVDPRWRSQGMATRLRDARVDHLVARYPGSLVATVTWSEGSSDDWYRRRWQDLGTIVSTHGHLVHAYACPQGRVTP